MPTTFPFPGSVYKLAPESNGLGQDVVNSPSIDQQAMSATAVICTPVVDRQGEIIMPDGVDSADWQKNPVILWEHGWDSRITTPIAKGVGPDGKLGLKLADNALEGTAWFTNKNAESAQIFDLIVEGIIRATSIHVVPVETEQQRSDSQVVTVYPRSTLLEWSWGKIGVNPEAVLKVLNSGRLNSEPICALAKSFLFAHAPRAKGNGIGADFGKGKNMTTPAVGAAKTEETPVVPEDEKPIEPGAELEQDDSPPSVRVANAVHASLKQLIANLEAAGNTYEDPRAKEYFGGAFSEQCSALVTEVEGLIGELGGKATGGDSDKPKEGEPEEDSDEALKSFLSLGNRQQLRVLGVASPLQSLVTAKNLRPEQKLAVQSVLKNIRKMTDDAKAATAAAKAKAAKDDDAQTKDLILSLAKTLGEAQSQLQEIAPAVA